MKRTRAIFLLLLFPLMALLCFQASFNGTETFAVTSHSNERSKNNVTSHSAPSKVDEKPVENVTSHSAPSKVDEKPAEDVTSHSAPSKVDEKPVVNASESRHKCLGDRLLVDPEKRTLQDNSGVEVIPFMIVPLMLDVYDFQEMICNISVPIRRLVLVQNMEEPMLTSYLNEMEAAFGWSGRLFVRRHPENIGYSGAVNKGLHHAMSLPREEVPFVFVTNSDVTFSPDLLPRLLRDVHNKTAHDAARMDELAEEVAREPSEYSPPNRPLKVLRSPDGNGILSTSALLPDRIRYAPPAERAKAFANHHAVFTMGSGFTSFFVSRLAISTVGFFDENFYPAYFEDPDYYWRLSKLGFHEFVTSYGTFTHNPGLGNRISQGSSDLSKSLPSKWWRRVKGLSATYRYAEAKWNKVDPSADGFDEPFNGAFPLDVWVRDDARIQKVRFVGMNANKSTLYPNVAYNKELLKEVIPGKLEASK